jgi:hypothetical protein
VEDRTGGATLGPAPQNATGKPGGMCMFGTLLKVVFGAAIVLGVTAFLGLFVMSSLARVNGVKEVAVPNASVLAGAAAKADYADAYRIGMEFCPFRHIDDVAANAFEKGSAELRRSETEVMYEGVAPGVRYNISYILDREATPMTLTVCTVVNGAGRTGPAYLTLVKPIHRMLVPYMVNRMSNVTIQ